MGPTISLIQEPYIFNPISAPTWIISESNSYLDIDFKYVYNLYSYDRINVLDYEFLGQYRISPRPTGQGVFDLHKIIKGSIDTDSSPTIDRVVNGESNLWAVPDGSIVKFRYKYGFQETVDLTFASTSEHIVGSASFVDLNFTVTPDIQVNDIININMSVQSSNTSYNGLCLVTGVTGSTGASGSLITTNIAYGVTQSDVSGTVLSVQRILGTSSFMYGINGSRQYYDPILNNPTILAKDGLYDVYKDNCYIFGVQPESASITEWNFLTSYSYTSGYADLTTYYKDIFLENYECISIISPTQSSYYFDIITYDVNFNIVATYSNGPNTLVFDTSNKQDLATFSVSDYELFTIGCGPKNLIIQTSDYDMFDGVTYYDFIYRVDDNIAKVRRKIVENCSSFPNYRLMFMNRLGGWDFYNFNYDSKYSLEIERIGFNKTLDWNYKIGDRGRSTLTLSADQQIVITTDWISEYDYNWLQELLTSPNVYVIDEVNMLKLPIIITDKGYEQKTTMRDKVFNMSLTFKYAYGVNTQSY